MTTVEELSATLVNLEAEAVQARQREDGTRVDGSSTADPADVVGRWCVQLQLGDGSHRHAHAWEAEVVHNVQVHRDWFCC